MHASPLIATAIVCAGLGLLAVPLHRLTADAGAATAAPPGSGMAAAGDEMRVPAVLRVRLLEPANGFRVTDAGGAVLWDAAGLPAGESEHPCLASIAHGSLTLDIHARFASVDRDTAVFLTVLPDGIEERQAHAIGRGTIDDTLSFYWTDAP